jgi:hypothetical protein
MHARLKTQCLLSHFPLQAGLQKCLTEALQDTLRVRHGRDARRLSK